MRSAQTGDGTAPSEPPTPVAPPPAAQRKKPGILDRLERKPDGLLFHGHRGGRVKPDTIRCILVNEVLSNLAEQFPVTAGERRARIS